MRTSPPTIQNFLKKSRFTLVYPLAQITIKNVQPVSRSTALHAVRAFGVKISGFNMAAKQPPLARDGDAQKKI
jgi:hypothetical protein